MSGLSGRHVAACQASKSPTCWRANRPANPVRSAHKTHSSQAWCCFMRRHTADVQARRQDGGAGRALRHLGDPVGKFFPLKILAGILYFPVPGVEKKKKLPVPRVTEISTAHLFISNLTRAVWGLAGSYNERYLAFPPAVSRAFLEGSDLQYRFLVNHL